MGKFGQILTVICRDMHIFSFLEDNLSKYQWSFVKLGMRIDIVEIWFWSANGQILSIFDGDICPETCTYFHFETVT